jgi:hypothetical protein
MTSTSWTSVIFIVADTGAVGNRILMSLDFHSTSLEPFHISQVRKENIGNKPLIDKVLENGMRLVRYQ